MQPEQHVPYAVRVRHDELLVVLGVSEGFLQLVDAVSIQLGQAAPRGLQLLRIYTFYKSSYIQSEPLKLLPSPLLLQLLLLLLTTTTSTDTTATSTDTTTDYY